MYAIIQTGGKQYRVTEGDRIRVELLDKELKEAVVFDRVLLVGDEGELKVGTPVLAGASVAATVITHDRRKKVLIFKKKRTTTYQRTQGHRQGYTEVLITGIQA
jgi:large subunit ribosomal protein L21